MLRRPFWDWQVSRRSFLGWSTLALGSVAIFRQPPRLWGQEVRFGWVQPREAAFFTSLGQGLVRCDLCPRQCEVEDGERGDCGVRENRQGRYYTLTYGNPTAVHIDPIEKKPLFHVLPGSMSYSIATAGCNLHCKFCQNWEISQTRPEETYNFDLKPQAIVDAARETGCATIAHTYVEPIIFYEYMLDIAKLSRPAGVLNVCHTAGYINPAPLAALCDHLQAACVDLKAFSEDFYQKLTGGSLAPVLESLKIFRRRGVHLEIVNLLIPQYNDDPEQVRQMCLWIREELGPLTPLHFSRFYPLYQLKHHYPTPVTTLVKAREIAQEVGLKYVYLGNVPGHPAESTFCHHCGYLLIARRGYQIRELNLRQGHCPACNTEIPGLWSKAATAKAPS